MRRHVMGGSWCLAALLSLAGSAAWSAAAVIAVASNFAETARALAMRYESVSGDQLRISSGSTGVLYAQIINGAPFDVFLAANDSEPARLAAEGYGAAAPFTYALGKLVVWSADAQRIRGDCTALLRRGDYRRLAIANPQLAPYGAAALAVLDRLGLRERLAPRLVTGANIAQTFQFAATGNAELGFVARAQVVALPADKAGSYCDVDASLYPPIRQQALLLKRGAGNAAAEGFIRYLQGAEATEQIRRAGYGLP